MLYKEHPSGRLCPSPSFVHRLQEKKVRKESERILHNALDDSDHEIHSASSLRLNFGLNTLT
jgi:hypothetical protein